MPRDQRLYMTFPIDFDEHPKVEGLSDAAFRAFVSMNGYSRRHGLDGKIPAATARRRWKVRALAELVASHPERPLVLLDGEEYVIRDYAEHQLTTADIEDLRQKRAEAGSKGGKSRASARAIAKQTGSNDVAESESRDRDRQTDDGDSPKPVTEVDAGEGDGDAFTFAVESAAELGIKDVSRVFRAFSPLIAPISIADAVDVARVLLALSTTHVTWPEAYLERTCENSPREVERAWASIPRPGVAA